MYDPFSGRRARRAQRRYDRTQNPLRALVGGVILIAVLIGTAFHSVWGSIGFLPILFIALAFVSLFGSFGTMRRQGVYGGMYGFIWFLGLALCFTIGFWPWILLPVAVTMILGALYRPIMSGMAGAGLFAATHMSQQPNQQQYYQQPYAQQEQPGYQQPYTPQEQPGYRPYQQGYQGASAQPHEAYQETSQQYEQPQVQYPEQQQQELPPMEQY